VMWTGSAKLSEFTGAVVQYQSTEEYSVQPEDDSHV